MAITPKKVFGALKSEIDAVDRKLDDAIIGIYTPGGSYTFENLPALSADTLGKVYTVTDAFTTTSDFVEGAGVDYPAGTNVAVVNRGTDADPVYKYDATTGAIMVDPAPTADSPNAVSSGGVYDALALKANDTAVVHKTGDETVAGDKTFSDDVIVDGGLSADVLTVDYSGNPIVINNASAVPAKALKVKLEPIQSGSGTPSPENVRPISGRTEESVSTCGKNLLDETTKQIDNKYLRFGQQIPYAAGNYVFSCVPSISVIYREYIAVFDENDEEISFIEIAYGNITSLQFTLPDNPSAKYFKIVFYHSVSLVNETFDNCQLELGTTATPYEPYQSSTVTLTFGETVYGGSVDFESGVVRVTKGYKTVSQLSWTLYDTSSGTLFRALIDNCKQQSNLYLPTNAISSAYATVANMYRANNTLSQTSGISGVDIIDDNYNTADAFKTGMGSVGICYELATPTTIQLTPAQLTMLKGYNYVTADGDIEITVVSGNILDDAKAYADETKAEKTYLATIEGDTASKPYSENDFMVRSDGLYKVTASIAQGASITSSNTTKTTVGEVLTALLNA